MTETTSDARVTRSESREAIEPAASRLPTHPTDRPIPLWPEGVLALAAGATLLVIGLRHRVWLQRKAAEIQRAVDEFQRHGGLEDLAQVARQAGELFRGG